MKVKLLQGFHNHMNCVHTLHEGEKYKVVSESTISYAGEVTPNSYIITDGSCHFVVLAQFCEVVKSKRELWEEIKKLQSVLSRTKIDVDDLILKNENLKKENLSRQEICNDLESQVFDFNAGIDSLKSNIRDRENERNSLKCKIYTLGEENQILKNEIEDYKKEIDEHKKEIHNLNLRNCMIRVIEIGIPSFIDIENNKATIEFDKLNFVSSFGLSEKMKESECFPNFRLCLVGLL